MTNRARVFEEALSLPEEDRFELAAELLSRNPAYHALELATPDYAPEVARRLEAIRQGEAKTVPVEEAIARLRERARR